LDCIICEESESGGAGASCVSLPNQQRRLQQIPFGAYRRRRRALIYGSEMINSPAQPNHGALARLHETPLRDANAAYQFELVTLLKITSLDAQYFVPRVQ
jgi:hypothetical protein